MNRPCTRGGYAAGWVRRKRTFKRESDELGIIRSIQDVEEFTLKLAMILVLQQIKRDVALRPRMRVCLDSSIPCRQSMLLEPFAAKRQDRRNRPLKRDQELSDQQERKLPQTFGLLSLNPRLFGPLRLLFSYHRLSLYPIFVQSRELLSALRSALSCPPTEKPLQPAFLSSLDGLRGPRGSHCAEGAGK